MNLLAGMKDNYNLDRFYGDKCRYSYDLLLEPNFFTL